MKYSIGTKVRVVKAFEESRTPCPEVGTEGTVVRFGPPNWVVVHFGPGFVDTRGECEWLDEDGYDLKFLEDEIEAA